MGWYSHKFRGLGSPCEVRISISEGPVVLANGPFIFGSYSDLVILGQHLKMTLKVMRLLKLTVDVMICLVLLLTWNRTHSELCKHGFMSATRLSTGISNTSSIQKHRHPLYQDSFFCCFKYCIFVIKKWLWLFQARNRGVGFFKNSSCYIFVSLGKCFNLWSQT